MAAIEGSGVGVPDGGVVGDLFGFEVFPGGGLALGILADTGFGGLFAQGSLDFVSCHAEGDFFFGDEVTNGDLAGVGFFELIDEFGVFGFKSGGGDPAEGGLTIRSGASDVVSLFGELEELGGGANFEVTSFGTAFVGRVDPTGFDDFEFDGFWGDFFGVDDAFFGLFGELGVGV